MKRFAILLSLILFLAFPGIALATYHDFKVWKHTGNQPLQLVVYDTTISPPWAPNIQAAIADWNQSSVVHLTYIQAVSCPFGTNVICVQEVLDPNSCYAYTTIYYDRHNNIISPPVFISYDDRCGAYYAFPSMYRYLACIELGHAIGLDNANYFGDRYGETTTCMAGAAMVNGEV